MIVKNFTCLSALFIAFGLATVEAAPAATTAPAASHFAIISPQVAAKLAPLASSPLGKTVIGAADAALTKEPGAIPKIHVEGTLPHQGLWDVSIKALDDWHAMLKFGLAWQLTHDPKYLQAEDKYLNNWMDTYQVNFNPIDETNFDKVILSYDLTKNDLPKATQDKVNQFLKNMSTGYLDKILATKDYANWQSHRLKLATMAAYSVGDEALVARAKTLFYSHLTVNLLPDSSTFDFHKRDALHYTLYDLEPLSMAALAAKNHGQDWFHGSTPGQPSIASAVDWVIPYATGEKTHDEFVHSTVAFDAQRAAAGMKGYSGPFDPLTSMSLFQLASIFDPKYQVVFAQLVEKGKEKDHLKQPQDWSTLLIQAGM